MIDADRVLKEFSMLLDSAEREADLQRFIEQHPWLIVEATEMVEPSVVISQLPLGPDFRVDFAYLSMDSAGEYIHLIEIESPKLQIFNESDDFTSSFNHATNQLLDWQAWFSRNSRTVIQLLEPLFTDAMWTGVPGHLTPRMHLFAGRRRELSNLRRKSRWGERAKQTPVRTYDGLLEHWNAVLSNVSNWVSPLACFRYAGQSFKRMKVDVDPYLPND
jgi:hypothetical protein